MSVDQMLMLNDDGALTCELSDEDDDSVTGLTLEELVNDWLACETLDGALHPYLDDTLWVLDGFNEAMIQIIEHFEDDDPHRNHLLEHYKVSREYLRTLVAAFDKDNAA